MSAQAQVGIVRTVEGRVTVFSGREECAPRYGLDLEEGDAVRTGEKSWALLTMMDGARITVRPQSEVRIDLYRYHESADPGVNRGQISLVRGALRVQAGRIALAPRGQFQVRTPDANATLRGADQDVTHIAQKPAGPADSPPGTYARAYQGEAVLANPTGDVTLRQGQTAVAEVRAKPRVLEGQPYFYHWHDFIDRRAAVVAEKLDTLPP